MIRLVDLFAGCGGLSLGVAEAARRLDLGVDIRLAVDVDRHAVAVYKSNFPEANVRQCLVEGLFDGRSGRPRTRAEKCLAMDVGQVDVLVGGPPCQGHSDLNNHTRRNDPRNALYARMARAAEVLRPTLVLVENVPTVTHDVARVVDATCRALARAGYRVGETVVDLTRLGVPQRRRRHVILASRRAELDPSRVLAEFERRCPAHPERSVEWAIGDLIDIEPTGAFDRPSMPSLDNAARIDWLFDRNKYDLPNDRRPKCHESHHKYLSMYGRLRWDEPAQTVTSGFGSMGQGRYVHPLCRRTLTPHEAARLQMLPDFWDFGAVQGRRTLARLIGNTVPPQLGFVICQRALQELGFPRRDTPPMTVSVPLVRNGPSTKLKTRRVGRAAPRRRMGVPEASSAEARHRMQVTRQRDTTAEQLLRGCLAGLGLKYDVDVPLLPGLRRRADVVFPTGRVAVFVDGCFWHGCPRHGTLPKANRQWWRAKLDATRERDADTDRRLRETGWTVLRFWEHDDPEASAHRIASLVAAGITRRSGETRGAAPRLL
jgi:DNA (cytosine-5)-methyltransferase 1